MPGDEGAVGEKDAKPREAAACVERGVQRYAEGRLPEAAAEFEAALALVPGHAQAIECLAWVREVVAGRRTLVSGSFTSIPIPVEESAPALEPAPSPPPVPPSGLTGRTLAGLPGLGLGKPAETGSQLEDGPDSVTREWHSVLETQNLPQLDVPELSEDQIANLLEVERGLTLSKGTAKDAPPASTGAEPAADDDEDEQDQTHVRLAGRVIELVAEEPTLPPGSALKGLDPVLEPLGRGEALPRVGDQTVDDPVSQPTNLFMGQRLRELDPTSQAVPEASVDELPSAPKAAPTAEAWQPVRAALERGEPKTAFESAEQLLKRAGVEAADGGDPELLRRVYEAVVGDLRAVPRFGKATPDLDSRSAFLLSRMDGSINADDLIDISGMKRLDALRVLAQLVSAGVVMMKR